TKPLSGLPSSAIYYTSACIANRVFCFTFVDGHSTTRRSSVQDLFSFDSAPTVNSNQLEQSHATVIQFVVIACQLLCDLRLAREAASARAITATERNDCLKCSQSIGQQL